MEDGFEILIPIIAVTGAFAIPIVWIWFDYATKRNFIESRHKERLAAIERGMEYQSDPLDSLLASGKAANQNRSASLLWGLILTFGGTAFMFGMSELESGSVVVAIGLALLLYYFLTKPSRKLLDADQTANSNH